MSWRNFIGRLRGKRALQKSACLITAASMCIPPALTFAAETDASMPTTNLDVEIQPATSVDMATETSMFDRVPLDSWIYTSINKLIATGKVPRYKNQIRPGATFTRFEMALITYYGIREMKFMSPEEQDILKPLEEEFRYDLEKISLMHRLSQLDEEKPIDEQADVFKQKTIAELSPNVDTFGSSGSAFNLQLPGKKPVLDDKLSIWGFARLRFQRNDYGNGTYRRYNHFNLHVINQYKVNDHWQIVLGNEFQRSTDRINSMESENGNWMADADNNVQHNVAQELILEGRYKGANISVGRMYDLGAYGFALDNRIEGLQVQFPGKINVTAFHGRVYDWPQEDVHRGIQPFMGWIYNGYGDRIDSRQEYTALKFDTRPDQKSLLSWGVYGISPSARHYQKDNRKRVIYGYLAYENQISDKWKLTGLIQSNNATQDKDLIRAERDYVGGKNVGKYSTSKSPNWYIRADYGKVDLFKTNTWGLYAFYLNQPTLRQYSDTLEFDNMRGFRFGGAYTIAGLPARDVRHLRKGYRYQRTPSRCARAIEYVLLIGGSNVEEID
ncbi:MAG: hypothetical protein IJ668_08030 [Selenomonadaceae bacterium]|nr:hypothetical protein [Selenomonadaceae bacterium]